MSKNYFERHLGTPPLEPLGPCTWSNLLLHCRLPLFTCNRFQGTDNHWIHLSPACREGQRSSSSTPWWSSTQVKQSDQVRLPKEGHGDHLHEEGTGRGGSSSSAQLISHFSSRFLKKKLFWRQKIYILWLSLPFENWGLKKLSKTLESIQSSTFTFIWNHSNVSSQSTTFTAERTIPHFTIKR